jgi:hypothetical protein
MGGSGKDSAEIGEEGSFMARILQFGEQMLVSRLVFIGPQVFKTKVDNDSDITSLLAAGPLNVWKSHSLLNWLRKTHARGGHCVPVRTSMYIENTGHIGT